MPTANRLRPLPLSEWAELDRERFRGQLARAEQYLSGASDAPPMPAILGLFARHSRLGAPWLAFSGTLLDAGALDPRDRELLTLRAGWRTRCDYIWAQHVGMGASAGLTSEQLAAVREDPEDGPWPERERDLLRAADELVDAHVVSDTTWKALRDHFDDQQLLEVLFVVGSYVCLAFVLNSVGLQPALPDRQEDRP